MKESEKLKKEKHRLKTHTKQREKKIKWINEGKG